MKNLLKAGLLVAVVSMSACTQAPKADKAEVSAPKAVEKPTQVTKQVPINTSESQVKWVGTKPTGRHEGTIPLKQGTLVLNNNTLVGGDFVMDMTALDVTDMDEENNAKLAGHLKNEDFFEVDKHPTSKFNITSVKKYMPNSDVEVTIDNPTHTISGNLTLKGVTKNVTFPANVSVSPTGDVKAKANFNINRTDWNLNYGADESLGDRFIRPEVNIDLDIKS